MNDAVHYELDGHVATITYHRPEALNAVNAEHAPRPQRRVQPLP